MKRGMKALIKIQAQRAISTASCVSAGSAANDSCGIIFLPNPIIRIRKRQINGKKIDSTLQNVRQCLQEIGRQQNECKQHLIGCDFAKMYQNFSAQMKKFK